MASGRVTKLTLTILTTAAVLLTVIAALLFAAPAEAQTPGVTITITPTTLAEESVANDIAVTATLSAMQSSATTVTLSLAGTANQGTDYSVAETLPIITIPPGQTQGSANVILTPTNDTVWEGDETIIISGTTATGGLEVAAATLTLFDNETRPTIELQFDPQIPGNDFGIPEESGTPRDFTIHAKLNGESTLGVDTPISLSLDNSDNPGSNYMVILPAMEIEAGNTTDTATATFTPVDNSERDDRRYIRIAGAADDHLGTPFTVTATRRGVNIVDDEKPLKIDLSLTPDLLREADLIEDAPVSFDVTVTLSGDDTLPSEVTVELFEASDACNLFKNGHIAEMVFPQGATSTSLTKQQTVSVTPTGAAIDEVCGFEIQANATNYVPSIYYIKIIPDENPSLLSAIIGGFDTSYEPANILNYGEILIILFKFNRPFRIVDGSASTTVQIGDTTRTASCGGTSGVLLSCLFPVQLGEHDLDGIHPRDLGPLTITGSTEDWYDSTIPLTVDTSLAEGNIVSNETYVHGAPSSYRLLPSIESLQEGQDPTNIRITATWIAGLTATQETTIPISFTDVTTTGADYTVTGTEAITILAGGIEGNTTIEFTPVEDGIKEARSETVLIEGGDSDNFVLGAEFEVIDSPNIKLTVPTDTIAENGGAETVTVTAELGDPGDSTRGRPIVVLLNVSGSAGPGDYTFAETLQVTIPAGARSGSTTFTLTPTDDRLLEGDETVVLSGSTPALTVVGAGTITIEDDETEPQVILTAEPDTIQENDSVPTQITVSAILDQNITLPDNATVVTLTLGGTATAGTGHDYTSAWNPQVAEITIPQGEREAETTVTLTVTPLQDEVAEGEETIVVEGTASTGLVVDVRGSVITVVDDDIPGIVLEPKSIEITEGGTASYTVALALEPTETVTVTMTTALGATDLSVDITELYFTPENWNQPQTVNVDAMEDVDAVADPTLTLVHEASGGAYEGVTSNNTVTIKEKDAPNVTVSPTTLQIPEGTDGTYTVVLTSQPSGNVTVTMDTNLAATDLSATPTPTELTFTTSNWSQPQTVTVSAAVDADAVDDAAITLEHSVSGGDYGGVTISSVTVTIIDQTIPTLSVTGGSEQEGASVDFLVTLSAESSKEVTVGYATADGTATSPSDYTAASGSLTFAAGETSKTVSVATIDDTLHEPTETFTLGLTNPTNAEIQSGAGTATGTITDDDPAPTAVTLALNPSSVGESAAETDITVTASLNNSPLPTATTVTVSRTGGTATSGTDYPAVTDLVITIPSGQTSATETLSLDPTGDGLHEGDETVILTGSATGLTAGTATLTITDDDTAPTAVSLSLTPAAVGESASATTVTVTASLNGSPLTTATTVTVSRTGGTATSGTDYPPVSAFTVTIQDGQTTGTATLSFDPTGDGLAEGDETIILTGSATGLTSGMATLTITDDDPAPTAITLALNPSSAGESAAATDITVTATLNNSPLPDATTVTVSKTGGTATSGTDYPAISDFTITIPAEQASGTTTLSFDPTGDGLAEGNETVILAGTATGLDPGTTTLTITDDDPAPTTVSLSLNPAAVGESAAATTITITASLNNSPLPTGTTVNVSRTGGTAISGTDYTPVSDFNIEIPSGQTIATGQFSFNPSGDALYEGDETVILTASVTGLTAGTATLTITDDDTAPTAVILSLVPNTVGESAANTTVTVTASLNGSPLPTVTAVTVSKTGGTATSGIDYQEITDFTVTIQDGQLTGTTTLSFYPSGDRLYETDETIILTATATDLSAGTATLTITDDDPAPTTVSISLDPAAVSEGAPATAITVTASLDNSPLPAATTVTVSRTGGTATSGIDYPPISTFTVTIPAEQNTGTAQLSFNPSTDDLYEGDESVILTGSAPGLNPGAATLTITDDNTAPTAVSISLDPDAIGESDARTPVTVTATLNNSSLPTATTVNIREAGGTATSGADYSPITDFTVTIPAGQTTGTATLSFDPTGDGLAEGDETVILTGTVAGLTAGTAILTITDDDPRPTTITLSLNPTAVSESANPTAITVTASLDNSPFPTATTVTVSRTGGTATSGTDYQAVSDFTVTIPAEQTSGTAELSFNPSGDSLAEGDETVILTATVTGLTNGRATLTITDDDPAPTTVSLSLNPTAVGESAAATDITVTATLDNSPLPRNTTVTVSRTGGTATSGTDYPAISIFMVTIPAEQTSGTATLSFDPTGDDLYEGNETVILTGMGGGLAAGTATLTITDDDPAPTAITLSLNPTAVGESAAATAIAVTASLNNSPLPTATTVTVSRTGGTATPGTDHPPVSDFIVTIPSGQTSGTATLSFDPSPDNLAEGDETVILTGSTTTGLTDGTATLTITDDDPAPTAVTLALNPSSVGESAAETDITVTASLNNSPLPTATTVTVSRTRGTATSGTDYPTVTNFTVTIPAGQPSGTATLSFDPSEDDLYEGDETVILTGTAPGLTTATVTLTITDDDPAPTAIILSLDPTAISESADPTDITVTASLNNSPLPTATTVTVSRTRGTATSGTDYPAITAITVTIPSGQTSGTATLSFDPTGDGLAEGDETVILTGRVTGLTNDTVTLTITDDDPAPTTVSLSLNPTAVGESAPATAITVTATLNNSPLPTATSVTVSRTGGTASGTDYEPAISNITVTIPAGQTSKTETLSFDPTGDTLAEGDETLIFTADAPGLTAGTATLTITDDDPAPTAITLSLSPAAVGESADPTAITITASLDNSPLPAATTVTVSRTGGTATSGTDYPAISDFTVTVPSGQTSGTTTLSFDPSGDNLAEGDETIILTASVAGLAAGTATLTITDDDAAPTAVILSLNPSTVGESAAATTVTVTASLNGSPLPMATAVTVSKTGGTATSGTDYPPISDFMVTIPSGQTTGTATLSFDPTGDGLAEGDESVILTGSATGLDAGTATLTITDDDPAPTTISLSLNPNAVGESAPATPITVTASLNNSPLPNATTVTVSQTSGTADSGTDYPTINNFTVTIPAEESSATATLSFDPTGDDVDEVNETVILTGSATGLTSGTATLTITDDDENGVTVSPTTMEIQEGMDATYTVVLDAKPAGNVTVTISGHANTDVSPNPTTLTFTTTTWSTAQTVTVTALEDDDADDEDQITLSHTVVSTDASYNGITAGSVVVSITDDDQDGVTVSETGLTIVEGSSDTYTVVLDAQPAGDVTITVNDPTDNTDVTTDPASLTFTTTDWNTARTVTVTAAQDGDAADETATITHTATSTADPAYRGISIDDVAITLEDDAPDTLIVNFKEAAYDADEGAQVDVTVTLDTDPERTITVPLTHIGQGGATSADYSGVPASVEFNSGDTEKTFSFAITDDDVDDDSESVKLGFVNLPAGVSEGAIKESFVSIINDDTNGVTISETALTIEEGNTDTYTVVLDAQPAGDVTVTIAGAGADVSVDSTTLTFTTITWSTAQTVTVTAVDDSIDDDDETVTITHTVASTADSDYHGTATGSVAISIIDNDVPAVTVSFGAATYSVAEGATITVTVKLSADPERTVDVPILVTPTDGASLDDFSGVPENVTLNSGDTEKTFSFSATQDTEDDDGERVILTFGDLPARVTSTGPSQAVVSITDDDLPADVNVSFGQVAYTVLESDDPSTTDEQENQVTIKVKLSEDPERTITVPITKINQDGATSADYSGVPAERYVQRRGHGEDHHLPSDP